MDETAIQWLERVILDELEAIVDERSAVAVTLAQRRAGREAMRRRIAPMLTNEARANELRGLGDVAVKSEIRKMYREGLS